METVIQNTEEWHKLRETRIGASEANIIMGVSDFTSPRQLHEVKVNPPKGERKENNFIQAKGHRTEPRLRAYIELLTGQEFPDEVALSEEHDFLMASLDGCCHVLRELAEFKLVGKADYELVKSGQILPQYKPQIMQQLFVTGFDKCHLVVGWDDKENGLQIAHLEVLPDIEYITDELYPALVKFWKGVKTKTPPPYSSLDVAEINNEKVSDMLHRYKLLLKDQEEMDKRVEDLKDAIFKETTKVHKKVKIDGITVYDIQSKDGVKIDYEQFIEDEALIIPGKYISVKKGARVKKITFPKAEPEKSAEEMIIPGAELPAKKTRAKKEKVQA